jgi:hypothetical protein
MTPDEILEIDAQRNYLPGIQAGNLRALINRTIELVGGAVAVPVYSDGTNWKVG